MKASIFFLLDCQLFATETELRLAQLHLMRPSMNDDQFQLWRDLIELGDMDKFETAWLQWRDHDDCGRYSTGKSNLEQAVAR